MPQSGLPPPPFVCRTPALTAHVRVPCDDMRHMHTCLRAIMRVARRTYVDLSVAAAPRMASTWPCISFTRFSRASFSSFVFCSSSRRDVFCFWEPVSSSSSLPAFDIASAWAACTCTASR